MTARSGHLAVRAIVHGISTPKSGHRRKISQSTCIACQLNGPRLQDRALVPARVLWHSPAKERAGYSFAPRVRPLHLGAAGRIFRRTNPNDARSLDFAARLTRPS